MGSSRTGLDLEDKILWPWPRRPLALALKIPGLGLGLDHVVLEHIPVILEVFSYCTLSSFTFILTGQANRLHIIHYTIPPGLSRASCHQSLSTYTTWPNYWPIYLELTDVWLHLWWKISWDCYCTGLNNVLPTMAMLSSSRSRNTVSSAILPISDRIVVWASCVMAYSASSTP